MKTLGFNIFDLFWRLTTILVYNANKIENCRFFHIVLFLQKGDDLTDLIYIHVYMCYVY